MFAIFEPRSFNQAFNTLWSNSHSNLPVSVKLSDDAQSSFDIEDALGFWESHEAKVLKRVAEREKALSGICINTETPLNVINDAFSPVKLPEESIASKTLKNEDVKMNIDVVTCAATSFGVVGTHKSNPSVIDMKGENAESVYNSVIRYNRHSTIDSPALNAMQDLCEIKAKPHVVVSAILRDALHLTDLPENRAAVSQVKISPNSFRIGSFPFSRLAHANPRVFVEYCLAIYTLSLNRAQLTLLDCLNHVIDSVLFVYGLELRNLFRGTLSHLQNGNLELRRNQDPIPNFEVNLEMNETRTSLRHSLRFDNDNSARVEPKIPSVWKACILFAVEQEVETFPNSASGTLIVALNRRYRYGRTGSLRGTVPTVCLMFAEQH